MIQTTSAQIWDLIQILASVLLGGIISVIVVWLTLKWTEKDKQKERKYLLYQKLITKVKAVMRNDLNFCSHGILFRYHKKLSSAVITPDEENRTINQNQAFYHQSQQSVYHRLLIEELEELDRFKIDSLLFLGKGKNYDNLVELIAKITHRENRKLAEQYIGMTDPVLIDKKKEAALNQNKEQVGKLNQVFEELDTLLIKALDIKIKPGL